MDQSSLNRKRAAVREFGRNWFVPDSILFQNFTLQFAILFMVYNARQLDVDYQISAEKAYLSLFTPSLVLVMRHVTKKD